MCNSECVKNIQKYYLKGIGLVPYCTFHGLGMANEGNECVKYLIIFFFLSSMLLHSISLVFLV